MKSTLHIGMAALSDSIFAGYTCKDGKTWREGKVNVTSDVLKSVVQFVKPGHVVTVNVNGNPKYEIAVREILSALKANPRRVKKISLSAARKMFIATAPDEKTVESYACPSLERTCYWNWFRIGIRFAETGKISKNDAAWVKTNPEPFKNKETETK
jgi:hypothetical protein